MDKPFLPAPDSRVVITVGRQFGSGGREFGLRLATRYGLKYYDKELPPRQPDAQVWPASFLRRAMNGPHRLSTASSPLP